MVEFFYIASRQRKSQGRRETHTVAVRPVATTRSEDVRINTMHHLSVS